MFVLCCSAGKSEDSFTELCVPVSNGGVAGEEKDSSPSRVSCHPGVYRSMFMNVLLR